MNIKTNIENKIKKKYGLKNVKLIYIKNVDGLINIKKILSEICLFLIPPEKAI